MGSVNKNNRGGLKKAGFTLIELLVVISIIALLSSVVLASVNSARQKAQLSKFNSSMEEFVKALEIYRTTYGYYPPCTTLNGVLTGVCSISTDQTGVLNDVNFTSDIINELKNKNIYKGDLTSTLSNTTISSKLNSIQIWYVTGQTNLDVQANGIGGYVCGGKKNFNEYYVEVGFYTKPNGALTYLINNSYLNKEYETGFNTLTGLYCAGN